MKTFVQNRRLPLGARTKRDGGNADSANHHERETRIPLPKEIQEGQDFARTRHSGKAEPQGEQDTRTKRDQAPPHEACRMMKTTVAATPMNVSVATIERDAIRLTPHTP